MSRRLFLPLSLLGHGQSCCKRLDLLQLLSLDKRILLFRPVPLLVIAFLLEVFPDILGSKVSQQIGRYGEGKEPIAELQAMSRKGREALNTKNCHVSINESIWSIFFIVFGASCRSTSLLQWHVLRLSKEKTRWTLARRRSS
ncbi:hypothetical protein GQ457_16G025540 [Hibiscus cannabinus]